MRIIFNYNEVTRELRVDTVGLYEAGSSDESYSARDISRNSAVHLFKGVLSAWRALRCPRCYQMVFDFLPSLKEFVNEKTHKVV